MVKLSSIGRADVVSFNMFNNVRIFIVVLKRTPSTKTEGNVVKWY